MPASVEAIPSNPLHPPWMLFPYCLHITTSSLLLLHHQHFFFFLNFQGNQKLGLWPCAFLLSAWILFLNPNNQRSVSKLDHFRLSQLVLCGFKNMLIWSYILLASFIHLFGLSSKNAHNLSIERRHLYFQFTPFIIRRVFEIKPKSITLVF